MALRSFPFLRYYRGALGLTISCSLHCAWEIEVTTKLGLCKLNMGLVSNEEASETLPFKVCIILSDPLSDGSFFYVSSVYNHCHSTILNCRLMMGLKNMLVRRSSDLRTSMFLPSAIQGTIYCKSQCAPVVS